MAFYLPLRSRLDWVLWAASRSSASVRSGRTVFAPKPCNRHQGRAGITNRVGWHTFRHTYSTLLKANEEDVKVVQELMRHANITQP